MFGSRNMLRFVFYLGNSAFCKCFCVVLGRKVLGSFKEDIVIDCCLK